MDQKNISEIAEQFGLTIETVRLPDDKTAHKVYKGVNTVFVGSEDAVRTFLSTYETDRPGLFEGSMYGYME
ncbi:MAG: hypothetical protein ABI646_04085 [Acidobacteriota bacterium]